MGIVLSHPQYLPLYLHTLKSYQKTFIQLKTNTDTHEWWTCRESKTVQYSASNGRPYRASSHRVQRPSCQWRQIDYNSQRQWATIAKQHSPDTEGLHTWEHRGYTACERPAQDQAMQNPSVDGEGLWCPNPSWGPIGNRWLPREAESVLVRESALISCPWSHTHAQGVITKWTLWD